MVSEQSEALNAFYRMSSAALRRDPPLPLDRFRDDIMEHWGDVTAEPRGVDYLETDAGGVPALWAIPKDAAEDRALLCLHGGGFISGSTYTHRKLFAHLAKAAGVRALSVEYRRTPEFQHPAPLDDAVAAYRWLLEAGFDAGHVALVGDSAGGGLTVTTTLRARELGLPPAAALLPLSPWFDFELAGDSLVSNQESDVLFGRMDLAGLVSLFLGETGNRTDPLVNPLHADLAGLPPTYIQVGDAEMLLDDSRRFADLARDAGVDVTLDVFPEQQHTFQMSVGRAPEADDAVGRLASWVRPRLGLPAAADTLVTAGPARST